MFDFSDARLVIRKSIETIIIPMLIKSKSFNKWIDDKIKAHFAGKIK